jgi:UDP-glucose 4-epimerase
VYSEAKGEYAHPTYKPINEDYPTETVMGFYGLTKLFGEKIGFQYEQKHGITFVALRLSSTYGPGKLLKHGASSATTIQARIIENAMLGKLTRISQGLDQKNDFIYYKDVAKGIVLACTVEGMKDRIFNIGSGHASTLGDFAKAIRRMYPNAEIEIGPGLDYLKLGRNAYNIYDISRAKNELGFSPEFDPERAVEDYVEMLHRWKITPIYTPNS